MVLIVAREAHGADIYVTYFYQRTNGGTGCSLQEAIYAAEFRASLAIPGIPTELSDNFVPTNCTPGDGNDTIILPTGQALPMTLQVPDSNNYLGPTATPLIFSNITIEANGAQLVWLGHGHARAFSVGSASVLLPNGTVVTGTGNLVIRNLTITNFTAKGGDGASGGGGGMGAGGAIFVGTDARVTVENSTLYLNSAIGGNGSTQDSAGWGGGGGGLGGNGGAGVPDAGGGGGGGGSSGNGGAGGFNGGGGGGTLTDGFTGVAGDGGQGGFNCGGNGGGNNQDGSAAQCRGGGGGGGGDLDNASLPDVCASLGGGTGAAGAYGGGGGGGAFVWFDFLAECRFASPGGNGGFGGGGGAAGIQEQGGAGGFGGGGGASRNHPGRGGTFGGDANDTNNVDPSNGGGGAGLGGAIFSDGGIVIIRNSTLTANLAAGGSGGMISGLTPGQNGQETGGAIFVLNGSLIVNDSTIVSNQAGDVGGGGIEVFAQTGHVASFTLDNTIVFNNGGSVFVDCEADHESGGSINSAGVANLIGFNSFCDVVAAPTDPELGPLQNNGGLTPTMLISTTGGAYGTADAATSLMSDQRGRPRPSLDGHGFDIGAVELCTGTTVRTQIECLLVISGGGVFGGGGGTGQIAQLTMQVLPAGTGTTTPGVGTTAETLGSVVPIQATPNVGSAFTGWSANVTDPTNPLTTVIMNQDQTVTANFATCPITVNGRGTASSSFAPARVGLVWTGVATVDHYDIMRGPSAVGPFTKIGSVPAGTTSFSDTTVSDTTTYDYTADAMDANGNAVCVSNAKGIYVP